MQEKNNPSSKTQWHHLLFKMFEELLTPAGIMVFTDVRIMSESPKSDILLLRRKSAGRWTPEQKNLLPDGIRDSAAHHILIEFKYTESVNKIALLQTLGYDYFYKTAQNLSDHEVQTVLISAKTPRRTMLADFGFVLSDFPGVYHSTNILSAHIILLSLNELSEESHNAFIKCFASKMQEKKSAFQILKQKGLSAFGSGIESVIDGLMSLWLYYKGEEIMDLELTPERVMKMGKKYKELMLSGLTTEELMKVVSPEKLLKGLRPEERLKGLRPEERLKGLKPEERLKGLKPEERLAGLSAKEIEKIETYLKKMKQKGSGS